MTTLETLQAALADRYHFEREIGSGGMATVYLARDLRHQREVAFKVLKPELGAVLGAERFLSEIRVTANLQHPNLLPLFDSGEAGGLLYYVMPFVAGETLRSRIDREKQLPVEEAVRISVAVASALGYAHEHGVIHRDLKPENILIQAGQPVIADFGIALAVSHAGGARVTQTGLSLGTPQYMSPEQAAGDREIDARSDIYSLGAVTYEMLAGEPPHSGTTAQAIIAKLMTSEPRELHLMRPTVPVNVAAAVEKALAKLPADRFAKANDFAQALTNPSFSLATRSGIAAQMASGSAAAKRWQRISIGLGASAALLLIAALWGWLKPAPLKPVMRSVIPLDSTQALNGVYGRIAISPDGSTIAFTGGLDRRLYVRRRDELNAVPLPGTEGALGPFFSPDGQQLAFTTLSSVLKVVSLKGGPPTILADSVVGRNGGSWGSDGQMYMSTRTADAIVRLASSPGSKPTPITVLDSANGEVAHRFPDVLPNGKGVIFTIAYGAKGRSGNSIAVADIATHKHTVLVNGTQARYAASGHLLYVTENGTLMAVPFDQSKMRTSGEPTAIAEGMRMGIVGSVDLAISRTGTLLYVSGAGQGNSQLSWVARDGTAQPVDSAWHGFFQYPSISPDGTRLAVSVFEAARTDVWIKQLDRGPSLKLTFDVINNSYPSWAPDGRSVTFYSSAAQSGAINSDLWTKRADGSAQAVRQLHYSRALAEALWSHDGRWLVIRTSAGDNGVGDILALRPGTDTVPIPLEATKFSEYSPTLSPDDRWLAYSSNETGRDEVYVAPFPNAGTAKWPVSTGGGSEPLWSHHGNELFYRDATGNMVSVTVSTKPTFSIGAVRVLFPANRYIANPQHREYDISKDDSHFLMVGQIGGNSSDKLIVVDNSFDELKAKARK